ncbi:MAG: carbohydrate porin [Ghiorsea sp.]|nr:carbohydrate porin [Ghiorsea sp.]
MKKYISLGLCILFGSGLSHAEGFLGKTSSAEYEADVHEHKDGLFEWPGITGSWGGFRETLEKQGFTISSVYTGEFAKNFTANPVSANNQKKTVYHTNTDLTLTVDTEKAGAWKGGTFFIYGLGNTGAAPSDYTGDLQGYSNIEAPNKWLIYEAWYEQTFGSDLSILAGLHDMNSEFYVSDYASLFLNSSFGIGPDLTGNVPASIFPKAALGIRVKFNPTEQTYIQAAFYDGDSSTRTFKKDEGKLWIIEAGIHEDTRAYEIGCWQYTAKKTFSNQTSANDYGLYAIAEQDLVKLAEDKIISGFVQLGYAPESRNEIYNYMGAGLHMHGLVPNHVEDDIGLAIAQAKFHAASNAEKVAETAIELTYRLVVTPLIAIQPSMQWIQHAGGDSTAPLVKAGLLRFEVSL